MKAIAPNGLCIVGQLEVVCGNALGVNFRRDTGGSLGMDYAGETSMFWDEQKPVQRGGPAAVATEMLTLLKRVHEMAVLPSTMVLEINDIVSKAEAPLKDVFLDEDGGEWAADQIELIDETDFDAVVEAGYRLKENVVVNKGFYFLPPGMDRDNAPTTHPTAAAAWRAAIADMKEE